MVLARHDAVQRATGSAATGVMIMFRSRGSRIEPPALNEYAVEPVGVATTTPSAT